MKKIINFIACPGAGKSVGAAWLYAELARAGVRVDLVREVHREVILQGVGVRGNERTLANMQEGREKTAFKGAEWVVTDGPLALVVFYARKQGVEREVFGATTRGRWAEGIHLLINPDFSRPFDPRGRLQNADEARALQGELVDFMIAERLAFHVVEAKDLLAAATVERVLTLMQGKEFAHAA